MCPGFNANSDGDVVLHAICNAITSLTGVSEFSEQLADDLCLKDRHHRQRSLSDRSHENARKTTNHPRRYNPGRKETKI